MRSKKALKNIIANLLLQLTVAISGLILPRFFIIAYGSTMNGMIVSVTQFITYLALVEAGVSAASIVGLYKPLADNDLTEVNRILSATKRFYYRSGVAYTALLAVLVIVYPMLVNNQIDENITRFMILILAASNLVDYLFLGKYKVLLMANQKGYVMMLAQTLGTVLNTIITIILILEGCNVLLVKLVATVIYILRFIIIWIYVRRHYKYLNFNEEPNYKAINQRWAALLHQITGVIVNNTPVVVMTVFMGAKALVEVSIYGVYNMIAHALSLLVGTFNTGLQSGFGELLSKGDREALDKAYSNYEYLTYMVVFWAYTCMAVLIMPFIEIYTRDFTDAVYVRNEIAIMFVLVGIAQNVRIPSITLICAAGHYKQTRWRAILETCIIISVSLILVKPYGMLGVLIGSFCSFLYRGIDIVYYNTTRIMLGSWKRTLKRIILNGLILLLLTLVGNAIIPNQMSGYMEWFMWAIILGVVAVVVFVVINAVVDKKEFKVLIDRIRKVVVNDLNK
ncbi:MAG: hypothetical protein Q4F78_06005 [Bacillota bacterium]|nr:hypothetical protein [Bacillota bacterium]